MLIPVSNSYVCQLSVSCLNTYLITAGTARNQQLSMMTAAVDTLMLWGLEVVYVDEELMTCVAPKGGGERTGSERVMGVFRE